jgi:putative ABC transport system ATP-binding protein
MGTLIRFRGLTRSYASGEGVVHALRGVDLEIAEGELLAITGASGSGKSTALNIMGTLDRPDTGTYELDGEAVEGRDDVELAQLRNRKIGFVFQSFHLLAGMSALENVELPMIYAGVARRVRRDRAAAALDRVGLGDRMAHHPNQLSGGQQQRVAIARAVVNEPKLLLADEPTGALDSSTTAEILALFRELSRQGVTLVVVTHDPSVASFAARRMEFRDGGIVADSRGAA